MNSKIAKIFFLVFILIVATTTLALIQNESTNIFAVTENEKGMIAKLTLFTVPGDGEVAFITSNSLVGKDTQITGNIALEIAQKKTSVNINNNDFIFDIKANAYEVDGPSAGAAMALLAYSVLSEKPLSQKIGVTGTINSDGSVGVVGGVYPKAKVAYEKGIELFMIPKGEANQIIKEEGKVRSVNLLKYAPENWGMKVIEIVDIDEVIKYAYTNINEIEIDSSSGSSFIPESINYGAELTPMKLFSDKYIERANKSIKKAKKELETTKMKEDKRPEFYQQLGIAERNVEMAQLYLDQNYLYSAANYAFNSKVLADAISEVAEKPSLLTGNKDLLLSEMTFVERDINLLKEKFDFIPLDKYEWLIGAQQRISYAENAIYSIQIDENSQVNHNFEDVYSICSARAWLFTASDFLEEAASASSKKENFYSKDFIKKVQSKLIQVDDLLSDVNAVSEETYVESLRRFNSAKISLKNEFYFAALYDAFFAESFFNAELNKKEINDSDLKEKVLDLINNSQEQSSIWSELYRGHASFFVKQSEYKSALGYNDLKLNDLSTSYNLAYLANRLEVAKNVVDNYVSNTDFNEYVSNQTNVSVEYIPNDLMSGGRIYYFGVLMFLLVFLLVILIFMGWNVRRQKKFWDPLRAEKLCGALSRLDKALHQNKISDAEYFFLKKQYEGEFSVLKSTQSKRSQITLSLDEARAKLRALQTGLTDFKKHYRAGLILSEDYDKHLKEVNNEINDLKEYIKKQHSLLRKSSKEIDEEKKELQNEFKAFGKPKKKKKNKKLKGTEEIGKEEAEKEKEAKKKRREKIKKFKNKVKK